MIGGTAFWYPHTITVEDPTGSTGMGGGHSAARDVDAEVKDQQRLVRTADGSQAVSSTTITVPIASAVTAGALVTVWAGTAHERTSTVIAVERDENPPPLPSHLILSLE